MRFLRAKGPWDLQPLFICWEIQSERAPCQAIASVIRLQHSLPRLLLRRPRPTQYRASALKDQPVPRLILGASCRVEDPDSGLSLHAIGIDLPVRAVSPTPTIIDRDQRDRMDCTYPQ